MFKTRRKPLIVANWKMHYTVAESLSFVTMLTHEIKALGDVDVAIAAPYTSLYSLGVALSETDVKLAAQNLFWEESGAYTGEISGAFLKDVGCHYVIIGHSERRRLFGETNEMIQKKIGSAVGTGLVPILCVGEGLEEREQNQTWDVVEQQLKQGLKGIPLTELNEFTIAYEPVWAIGTGKNASPSQAEEVHSLIRNWISRTTDAPTAEKVRILYGGSVKSSNARELLKKENIDGALVGGASLDAKQFADILRQIP